MLSWIKIKISRIFCLHQWETDISFDRHLNGLAIYGSGILKAWICKKCGKQVYSCVKPISFYK